MCCTALGLLIISTAGLCCIDVGSRGIVGRRSAGQSEGVF